MSSITNYWVFLLSGILLNITPGVDTIYILSRSIYQGKKAGVLSTLGIGTGVLFHTLFVTLGLSVIIANSLLLFSIIKFTGALYLTYLGITTIFSKTNNRSLMEFSSKKDYVKIYFQGLLTNLTNPKVVLFFLTFLPQFINEKAPDPQTGFIILGLTFVSTGTIWCLLLAVTASFFTEKLRSNNKIAKVLNKLCGVTFIGLGVKIAFTSK